MTIITECTMYLLAHRPIWLVDEKIYKPQIFYQPKIISYFLLFQFDIITIKHPGLIRDSQSIL